MMNEYGEEINMLTIRDLEMMQERLNINSRYGAYGVNGPQGEDGVSLYPNMEPVEPESTIDMLGNVIEIGDVVFYYEKLVDDEENNSKYAPVISAEVLEITSNGVHVILRTLSGAYSPNYTDGCVKIHAMNVISQNQTQSEPKTIQRTLDINDFEAEADNQFNPEEI